MKNKEYPNYPVDPEAAVQYCALAGSGFAEARKKALEEMFGPIGGRWDFYQDTKQIVFVNGDGPKDDIELKYSLPCTHESCKAVKTVTETLYRRLEEGTGNTYDGLRGRVTKTFSGECFRAIPAEAIENYKHIASYTGDHPIRKRAAEEAKIKLKDWFGIE